MYVRVHSATYTLACWRTYSVPSPWPLNVIVRLHRAAGPPRLPTSRCFHLPIDRSIVPACVTEIDAANALRVDSKNAWNERVQTIRGDFQVFLRQISSFRNSPLTARNTSAHRDTRSNALLFELSTYPRFPSEIRKMESLEGLDK